MKKKVIIVIALLLLASGYAVYRYFIASPTAESVSPYNTYQNPFDY
jgi:flagellar basal body-associated protein FliL